MRPSDNRVQLQVSPEHRDMLKAAAERDKLTMKAAVEALIELYNGGEIEIIQMVKAKQRRTTNDRTGHGD